MALFGRKKRGVKLTDGEGLSVTTLPPEWWSLRWGLGLRGSYGYIYRTQPNVREVIDYLAEQGSSVRLKFYERVPNDLNLPDDRIERRSHPLAQVLDNPNPSSTRSRLWKETIKDFHIYDAAYWRKVRIGGRVRAVQRICPINLNVQRDALSGQVTGYTNARGEPVNDLVVFQGYDPERTEGSISPLETLRQILAEEQAATAHRTGMWRNGTRREGVVERPLEAPKWSPEAEEAWRADFEATMSGPANAGRVAILKEGMGWKPDGFNPKEMEYLGARQLTRKESAALFRVDPRLVFASDEAVTPEVRTSFYVDRLMPLLTWFAEEIDLQLLPDFEPLDNDSYYSEFNIQAKLQGSFEEQARIFSAAVGGPFLLVDEARAKLNLSPVPGGDQIYVPLNSVRGGGPQGSPQSPVQTPGQQPTDVTPTPTPTQISDGGSPLVHIYMRDHKDDPAAAVTPVEDRLNTAPAAALRRRDEAAQRYTRLIAKELERQGRRVVARFDIFIGKMRETRDEPGSKSRIETVWGDPARWDLELAENLRVLTEQVVDENARRALGQLGHKAAYSPERTRNYIATATTKAAIRINENTRAAVSAAIDDESLDDLEAIFRDEAGRAARLGASFATDMINFGRIEGAKQGGGRQKTWIVTSSNSRHPDMNGEQADLQASFSNGLDWPGQYGNPEESAGCQCLVDLS